MVRRTSADPIAALTWVEVTAVALAFAADFYLLWPSRFAASVNPIPDILFLTSSLAAAACVFSIPHRPNRRFILIGFSVALIGGLGWLPPFGIIPLVLSAVLAARLTLGFGFGGAAIAWGTGCLTILLRVIAQTRTLSIPSAIPLITYYVLVYAILLGLAFGVIAIMALYAARSASSAASAERARIALEIHDSIGHGLTTLAVQIEAARRYQGRDSEKAAGYLERAAVTTNELLSETRETVAVLHGDFLDTPASFEVAIGGLIRTFATTHEITVLEKVEVSREPPREVSVALYRVLQEALTNIARHAGAKEVRVSVAADDRAATLRVEDDGRGFRRELARGQGLGFMRERIASVGGVIEVDCREGRGTVVEAWVPLDQRA